MIQDIVKSIQAYFKAFALISKLNLWRYFVIPIIISVVIAIVIFTTAYGLSDNIGAFISDFWIWNWGKEIFEAIGVIIGWVVIIALGLIVYKHIVMALSAPFMSSVSEKIEAHILGIKHHHRNSTFSEQLWRGIRLNTRNLMMELFLTIPILFLKFIPVINIFSTALLFLVQAYYAGFGTMDYTLERHYGYKESIQFVRKNRGSAIGNGAIYLLLLFIPVLGVIIALPYAVTSSSLRTIETIQKN